MDIIKLFSSILITDLPNAMNFIRVLLAQLRKRVLKKVAGDISDFLSNQHENFPFLPWYLAALDHIEYKIYKPKPVKVKKQPPKNILKVLFTSKAIDFINLPKILRSPEVIKFLPSEYNSDDSPMVVYKLSDPIRSKIFNYKACVESIDVNEFLNMPEIYPCNCLDS